MILFSSAAVLDKIRKMSEIIEADINHFEERLRQAMLKSQTAELDKLLSTELLFTNHLGQVISKEDDISAHTTRRFQFNEIKLSEQKIVIRGDIAIVSVKADIVGSYENVPTNGCFRFTRVWNRLSHHHWQVIAGHSSTVT